MRKDKSLRWKILVPLSIGFIIMAAAFVLISYLGLRDYVISDRIERARRLSILITDELDAEHIDDYIEQGYDYVPEDAIQDDGDPMIAGSYDMIEDKLYRFRSAFPDLHFLYIYQFHEDGATVVFDLDSGVYTAFQPGTVVPYDKTQEKYIPLFLNGEEIPPIISNNTYGFLLTIFNPVYNSSGDCVCYIGIDYSMQILIDCAMSIIKKIIIFFVLIVCIIIVVSFFAASHGIIKPMKKLIGRAYQDTLTGLWNRTAYYEEAAKIDKEISTGQASLAILMIDVNFLKKVNDNYGHEKGNDYLKAAAALMQKIFGVDQLYRVGGDEFVVITKPGEYAAKVQGFRDEVRRQAEDDSLQPWEKVSAAVGAAEYESGRDTCTEDVLKRADEAMYAEKKAMKAERKD